MWKKLNLLLDDKFPAFSFYEIRFLNGFHLVNLGAFAVSFPNGGSTKNISTTESDTRFGFWPNS